MAYTFKVVKRNGEHFLNVMEVGNVVFGGYLGFMNDLKQYYLIINKFWYFATYILLYFNVSTEVIEYEQTIVYQLIVTLICK